ncbi:type II toxin-antitoxin system HicB family antitoxin [Bacillus sp. FDAARGOS_235]|uniref:type II toxin-antitoxin system HicB family antitoxin n=1 Tax=Bacillus sp. FDAARGOS_235 TaxID=1839798 RepID=UPI00119CB0DF|nr:type II toxin-antitoxin system HicB family antitoxin [Bacillus sp. FDAARGOS_235]
MNPTYKDFYSFTAILEKYPNETRWSVSFPDLPGCLTQGDNVSHAINQAKDVLGSILHSRELSNWDIPEPTPPEQIILDNNLYEEISKKVMVQIDIHMPLYRKAINNKAVKKTLTIPQWLNEAAIKADLNFSQVLQDALREQLNIKLPFDNDYNIKAKNNDINEYRINNKDI